MMANKIQTLTDIACCQSLNHNSEIAISVQNLTKVYKLYDSPIDRLKESLNPLRCKYHHDFSALRDISFDVKKGETVGIIGKNGSGKSTLLKIISGVITPSSGTVMVNGKVSALLELGAGFNPELTGIENVRFNGMLMGYTREEIEAKLDDILAFADIGEFVHQPVKMYSSGMFARLAFSVAVSVEPEILIVDEALSVGDVFFQQKCFKKMKAGLDSGRSLLYVSHDLSGMQKLCKRGILLSEGQILLDGTSIECASAYYLPPDKRNDEMSIPSKDCDDAELSQLGRNIIKSTSTEQGARQLEILFVSFGVNGELNVECGEYAIIRVLVRANSLINFPSVGISLFDRMNNLVYCTSTRQLGYDLKEMHPLDEKIVSFRVKFSIQPGVYSLSVGCNDWNPLDVTDAHLHHRYIGLGPITVVSSYALPPFYGITQLACEISMKDHQN